MIHIYRTCYILANNPARTTFRNNILACRLNSKRGNIISRYAVEICNDPRIDKSAFYASRLTVDPRQSFRKSDPRRGRPAPMLETTNLCQTTRSAFEDARDFIVLLSTVEVKKGGREGRADKKLKEGRRDKVTR